MDWVARERGFRRVVEEAKRSSRGYDCLIPVSGGKDSIWQVVTSLDYGLNPLTVTWRDPMRLPIGQENLDALIRIGVDHIDYSINPTIERKFLYRALEKYGIPGIPKHMALYNIPLRLAVKFGIPLIVWAENPAIEYGDLEPGRKGDEVDWKGLIQRGITQGTTAEDWVSDELPRAALTSYFAPSEEELERNPVRAVFLGYYFPWDPLHSYEVARAYGFRAPEQGPGYYVFDDVDSGFISIHHYLKWYKFGYTRLFDNLSHDIRHGRMSRREAVEIIRERGAETPHADIDAFCRYIGISRERFFEIAERFRNHDIWTRRGGKWLIEGFIVPDWDGWEEAA